MGPKNDSSNVDGTPESDVMAEYTSLGVSLIVLVDSDSVGVMPCACSSLANLGLFGFDSSSSLSSSTSELSSCCSLLLCYFSSSYSLLSSSLSSSSSSSSSLGAS
jgi:hypothetical protein